MKVRGMKSQKQYCCNLGNIENIFSVYNLQKRLLAILAIIIFMQVAESILLKTPSKNFINQTSLIAREKSPSCHPSENGPVVDWKADTRLSWDDFMAVSKGVKGFAVATATSRFVYEIKWIEDNLKVNVFVRFYCHESWKNPRITIPEVLDHEQLHFDICELYGRTFYLAILEQCKKAPLNESIVRKIYSRFQKEFNQYQDLYDDETDNSTNGEMQKKWEQKIARELLALAEYADYKEF